MAPTSSSRILLTRSWPARGRGRLAAALARAEPEGKRAAAADECVTQAAGLSWLRRAQSSGLRYRRIFRTNGRATRAATEENGTRTSADKRGWFFLSAFFRVHLRPICKAGPRLPPPERRTLLAVAALAAATLLLESALTRLLAVAQYYHFAFLVISLALLGFGASGTYLSLVRRSRPLDQLLPLTGAGFALSTAIAYAVVNGLPFDSYSIAWERRQILFFALYYLSLIHI